MVRFQEQLFPIFRDRADLNSSPNLSESIREALRASAYLIVICGPAAAGSRWANQEIIEFIKLGRADRIHALIVDGDPSLEGEGGAFLLHCTPTWDPTVTSFPALRRSPCGRLETGR